MTITPTLTPTLLQEATVSEQSAVAETVSCIGPGSQLKTARESRRLTIEEVAKRLHLTKTMVNDIENDRYHKRLAFTFIRGYLRSYARLVRISPEAVLNAFEQLGLKEHRSELNLPKVPVTTWRAQEKYVRWASYGIIVVLLAVVAGLAAWWFYQPITQDAGQQDLIKLLNNVSPPEKRTSATTSSNSNTSSNSTVNDNNTISSNNFSHAASSEANRTSEKSPADSLIPSPNSASSAPVSKATDAAQPATGE